MANNRIFCRLDWSLSWLLRRKITMRRMLGFTLVGVLGLTGQIAACAEGSTLGPNETGGGGSGGNGNEGGSGGNQCTTEICDGFDNDCDGDTDEGCACRSGETGSCYSGPPSTVDIGSCKSGMQTCLARRFGSSVRPPLAPKSSMPGPGCYRLPS